MSHATLAALALRLITKHGKTATIKTITTATPDNPGTPVQTAVTQDVKMVTFPVEQKYLRGGDILITDTEAYLAANGLNQAINGKDKIVIGGVTHRIVGIEEITPGDVPIVYILFLRK